MCFQLICLSTIFILALRWDADGNVFILLVFAQYGWQTLIIILLIILLIVLSGILLSQITSKDTVGRIGRNGVIIVDIIII